MSHRESLKAILNFERPENLCQFEWGYWPETIQRWLDEGMPQGNPWDALDITHYERVPVQTRFFPYLPEEILSETETTRIIKDGTGVTMEVSKEATAFPRYIEHPVKDMKTFESYKEHLDPGTPGRFPENWNKIAPSLNDRDYILVMGGTEISFFGWHRDLMGVENLLLAYYDQPELIHAISRHHLDFIKALYSKILEDVEFDFIFVWEDMSFKNGPLISPALVREFMLPYYRELVDFFRQYTDNKFLLDSDGDVSLLIPLFTEAGIDGMLPFEVAAGMDITKIREKYPDLIICGGLDKRELAKGKDAIDRELKKLEFMFSRGGYLPTMDHHVPPEVSYHDFQYYIDKTCRLYKEYGC